MARWVMNRLTGLVHDVPDDHWSLTHADYETAGVAPVAAPAAPKPVEVSELPVDFPARDVLIAHGFTSERSLTGMTEERLRRLRGIGPAKARAIIEAL